MNSLEFQEDEWVLLKFFKSWLHQAKGKNWQGEPPGHQQFYARLAKTYYGPFQILQRINERANRQKFLDHCHIHNAFHVSLLKKF